MKPIRMMLAAALSCWSGAAAAQTSTTVDFSIGTVRLQARLPAGFCIPTGAAATAAQRVAAGDPEQETVLTLYPCSDMRGQGVAEYYLVKVPKTALNSPTTRAEMIAQVTAELTDPNFSAERLSENASRDASKSVTEAQGQSTEIRTDLRPLGRDKDCAYMGGRVDLSTSTQRLSALVGGCISAVGGRMIFIFRYGPGNFVPDSAKLLPKTRELLLGMSVRN